MDQDYMYVPLVLTIGGSGSSSFLLFFENWLLPCGFVQLWWWNKSTRKWSFELKCLTTGFPSRWFLISDRWPFIHICGAHCPFLRHTVLCIFCIQSCRLHYEFCSLLWLSLDTFSTDRALKLLPDFDVYACLTMCLLALGISPVGRLLLFECSPH